MTAAEWKYRYSAEWILRHSKIGPEHFTPAMLDDAYAEFGGTYAADPEGAAASMAADWHWESAEGLAEIWCGHSRRPSNARE